MTHRVLQALGASALAGLLLLIPAVAGAQAGSFTLPLPDASLERGVVTVKVTGADLGGKKEGQEVVLLKVAGGGQTAAVSRAVTGKDGRAMFKDLAAGESYRLSTKVEGTEVLSGIFPGPSLGGVRFLASLGSANAMTGAQLPGGSVQPGVVSGEMPAGHPPTAGVGINPSGKDSSGAAKITESDEVEPGYLLVRVVKGSAKTPVEGSTVQIKAGSAPTTGGGLMRKTDEKGEVSIQLPADKGARTMVIVGHDKLTYRSRSIGGGGEKGLIAAFRVFDRTSSKEKVSIGLRTQLVGQVGEGRISFMLALRLVNKGETLFDPGPKGLLLPLPAGASGLELSEDLKELLATDKDKQWIRFVAPLPPGDLDLRYFFDLPYDGPEMELILSLPLASSGASVLTINDFPVKITGPQVGASEMRGLDNLPGKQRLVHTLAALKAGESWEILFSGLPARDRTPHWIVMGIAGLIILWGIFAAVGGSSVQRNRKALKVQLLDELGRLKRRSSPSEKDAGCIEALRGRIRVLIREEI